MHIIVDGYNLIRQSDVLRGYERQSLEAGRKALIRSLAQYKRVRGHRITVVFDGWEGGSPLEERDLAGGVAIIYSRLGEKADEVIKRLVGVGSEEILVVTSDREIAAYANRRGKSSIDSPGFAARLDRLAAAPAPGADTPGGGGGGRSRSPRRSEEEGSRPAALQTETDCTRPDQKIMNVNRLRLRKP